MSDRHYDAIRQTYNDLYLWGLRVAAPFRPDEGSELARDDEDWPAQPLSSIVVSSMGSAREHLHAIRVHLDAGELFPLAHLSLARTALLSAAQAVWMLAPDLREERTSRARTLTAHVYDQHLVYLRDLQRLAAEPHAGTDAVAEHVSKRLAELNVLREAAGQPQKFIATNVIEAAAAAVWKRSELTLEARVEWRSGSGAAHGLLWPLLNRRGNAVGPADGAGMSDFLVGGSVDDMANSYMAAHRLLSHAFVLLDRRRASDAQLS